MTVPGFVACIEAEAATGRADSHRESKTRSPKSSSPSQREANLSVGRKLSHGPFRCDWCGELKPDIRRSGPRICRDCWVAYASRRRGA